MHPRRTEDSNSAPPTKSARKVKRQQEAIDKEKGVSKATAIEVQDPDLFNDGTTSAATSAYKLAAAPPHEAHSLPAGKAASLSDYKSAVTPRTIKAGKSADMLASDSLPSTAFTKNISEKKSAGAPNDSLTDKKARPTKKHSPIVASDKHTASISASRALALRLADSDAASESAKMAAMRPDGLTTSHHLYHQPPGAHRIGGHEDDDMDGYVDDDVDDYFIEERPPPSPEPIMPHIVASIVAPEADIETQTRNIEQRVRDEIKNSTTMAELVESPEEKAENEPPNSRRLRLLLSIIALLVIGVIIGLVVILTGGGNDAKQSNQVNNLTGPPSPAAAPATAKPTSKPTVFIPACTLCFDGTEPQDLTPEVRRGVTCADLQINLATLETADDQVCKAGQATAWLVCFCPTLPPRPLSSVCSAACPIDSRPPTFDSEVCRNFETFVEIVGQQEDECAGLIELTPSACVCSARITDMRDILKSVSDEQDLRDISTPQYMALEWLANKDPANLTISEMSGTALQNRYFGALLWFGFGGENWDEQYSFKSASDVCDWNDGDSGVFCDDPGTSLTEVRMINNGLVGRFPDEFTKFTNLVSIALYTNFISGTLPAAIGNLTELERIDLDGNEDLGGSLPSSFFELQKLSAIWLDDCSWSGSLPENIGNLISLTSLVIGHAELTGTIPASFSKLSKLEYLRLSENELSGNLPNLDTMLNVFLIDFSENSFWGTIPAHYGHLSMLESCLLEENFLTGPIPDLSGNAKLWSLILFDNILTGNIERVFTTTPTTNVAQIDLSDNALTGSIPATIGNFQQLQGLWLFSNTLTGSIPTEIGLLSNLWLSLDLYGNMLNGTVPTELPLLTSLSDLGFGYNELTGAIPSTLGLSTSLTFLDFQHNQLANAIPSELGLLTALEDLDLDGNLLTGTIPSQLGGLSAAQEISLARNKLTGTVPTEIALLSNLESLSVHINEITGDIGPYFCERLSEFETLTADCSVDDLKVVCDCCSDCY